MQWRYANGILVSLDIKKWPLQLRSDRLVYILIFNVSIAVKIALRVGV